MTKKDYIIIANAIKEIPPANDFEQAYLKQLAENFCRLFAKDNPKFDERRFITFIGKFN